MLRPILVAALFIAAGTLGWVAYSGMKPEAPPAVVVVPPVKILVAASALQAGTLVKDADFREKEVPAHDVPDGGFVANDEARAEMRGALLRRYIDGGDVVRRADILRPRDRGFLAAVLAPGTRAVSIGVDARTGASGLISPGDLVDVILTQEFNADTPIGRRVVAETVLSLIRVIAVDQQIAQGAPTASILPGLGSSPRVASTVTLQVTPEQAARVVVAERLGKLTLTVRSIDSGAAPSAVADGIEQLPRPEPERALEPPRALASSVYGADVSNVLSREEPVVNPKMRLIQGDNVSDVVFR